MQHVQDLSDHYIWLPRWFKIYIPLSEIKAKEEVQRAQETLRHYFYNNCSPQVFGWPKKRQKEYPPLKESKTLVGLDPFNFFPFPPVASMPPTTVQVSELGPCPQEHKVYQELYHHFYFCPCPHSYSGLGIVSLSSQLTLTASAALKPSSVF